MGKGRDVTDAPMKTCVARYVDVDVPRTVCFYNNRESPQGRPMLHICKRVVMGVWRCLFGQL